MKLFGIVATESKRCLKTQKNKGVTDYIQQLQDAINEAECQLVANTSFQDYTPKEGEIFDFIVVGAGSAGSVVANRLSENSSWKVLLLEAGGDPTVISEVPRLRNDQLMSDLDWKYFTLPESNSCLGNSGRRCYWPRGKVLGGSSTISTIEYVRGNPEDFDFWESQGNPGWGYDSMLQYFKKSEDMRVESILDKGNGFRFHGVGGLMTIDSLTSLNISNNIAEGAKELGMQLYNDVNAEFGEGLFYKQYDIRYTRRCSTAKAFLLNFQTRPNLKISKNSLVLKILFNKNKFAYGVYFTKNGINITAKVSKEVILSAGTVNSPQLLMLSGIGPKAHMEKIGINLVHNSRVGYNLQDHPAFFGFPVTMDYNYPADDPIEGMFQFSVNRSGYLTELAALNLMIFIKTSQASYRNIQFTFQYFPANLSPAKTNEGLEKLGFGKEVQRSLSFDKFSILMVPIVDRPKSKGRIWLKSANPLDQPLIQPRYLTVEDDVNEILEAISFCNKLVNTTALRELNAEVQRLDIPACRNSEFQSEDYWRCVIKYTSNSVNHCSGTCKMGPEDKYDSVVDPELRVIGVKRLRVVDASIMPTITTGNTNAPVIAIAEKASDMIKRFWD